MASVVLTRREARSGRLPPVCMVCGEPTSLYKTRTMSWYPRALLFLVLLGLLGIILLAILVSALQKRMRLEAPHCVRHQNHWVMRNLILGLSFLAVFIVGVGLFVFAGIQENRLRNDAFFGLACGGSVVLLLAWLVLALICPRPRFARVRSPIGRWW